MNGRVQFTTLLLDCSDQIVEFRPTRFAFIPARDSLAGQQRCRCGGGQRWTIKPRVHTARQGKGGHKVPVEAVSTDQVKDFVSNLYRTHGDDGQSVSIGKLDLL